MRRGIPRCITIAIGAPLLACVAPPTSGNPIFPGRYEDPAGVVFNGAFWVYPTTSAPSERQLSFDAYSSSDLVQWRKHERVLTDQSIGWAVGGLRGASVIEKDGKYYVFFAAGVAGDGREAAGIGVGVGDRPQGPFFDHLGRPLISTLVNGASPADPFVLRDLGGDDYLIYGDGGHCNIAKLNDDYSGFVPFSDGRDAKEITPRGYARAPSMFVRDGRYYLMWSTGREGDPESGVVYAIADSPLGPFEPEGDVFALAPEIAIEAGRPCVFSGRDASAWYIVHHRREAGENAPDALGVCIERIEFDEAGRIVPVRPTRVGVDKVQ